MINAMTILTDGTSLDTYLRGRLQEAIEQADVTEIRPVDRENLDEVTDNICSIHGVQRLELLPDQMTAFQSETIKAGYVDPNGQMTIHPTLIVAYRLPYTGSIELWNTVPNGELMVMAMPNPLGAVKVGGSDHLRISIRATGLEPWQLKNEREQVLSNLTTKVDWVNQQVDAWNPTLRKRIYEQLLRHIELAEQGKALDAASDLPLYLAPTEEQVPIPLERKSLRPIPSSDDSDGAQNPESVMAQAIYEDVVQTIEQMTRAMERTPTAAKLDEEEIRNLILFVLNANYRGAVAGEVFNGKGKTDILLRWDDANAFIGECKFWKGPKAFHDAIDQMLGYVTWRDTKAALIVFIRGGKPDEIMKKAQQTMCEHSSYKSEMLSSNPTRADYVLSSKHDDERLISVALIGVVIPEPTTAD